MAQGRAPEPEEIVPLKEAALLLGVSESRVALMAADGRLQCVRDTPDGSVTRESVEAVAAKRMHRFRKAASGVWHFVTHWLP
jgi:hypothetical protein